MEDYPEELRTPPVSLISIISTPSIHPTISAFLHSENPPINTLALPDFSKITIFAKKNYNLRDPLQYSSDKEKRNETGILKRGWLLKHRTKIPAVTAAVFRAEEVAGDPMTWLRVCTDIDELKAVIRGRNIKLVVILLRRNIQEEVSEDVMAALRKRADIDSKCLVEFVEEDASELRLSLNRLAALFAELCNSYYREEGRRIKSRIDKKNAELYIRYCFKVAVYAEFRRDWAEALRFYQDAYHATREMIGMSTRLPPIQRLVEIKAVSEHLHFKISTLLLHGGKVVEAITWFQKHISNYQKLTGAYEVTFVHWEWFSRQFLAFAELLETSSASIPSNISPSFGTSENQLTGWEFQPAYYYQDKIEKAIGGGGSDGVVQELISDGKSHGPSWLIGRHTKAAEVPKDAPTTSTYIQELAAKIRENIVDEVEAKVNQKVKENLTWVLKKLGEANPDMQIDVGDLCATVCSDDTGTGGTGGTRGTDGTGGSQI